MLLPLSFTNLVLACFAPAITTPTALNFYVSVMSRMNYYRGFGQYFASELRLSIPTLSAPVSISDLDIIRVRLHDHRLSPPELEPGRIFPINEYFRVHALDVGYFDIQGGMSVDIYPFEGIEDRILEMWLLGCVMAILLFQRGYFIMHACAVRVNDQIVAVVGDSGMGKSTLTAALIARGHEFVADDLVAISMNGQQPMILPGFPLLKLSEEIANRIGFDPETMVGRHPYKEKYFFHVKPASDEQLPLNHVILLEKLEQSGMEFVLLSFKEAFFHAIRHSMPTRWGYTCDRHHFDFCTTLSKNLPFSFFRRSFDEDGIERQVVGLEQYLEKSQCGV